MEMTRRSEGESIMKRLLLPTMILLILAPIFSALLAEDIPEPDPRQYREKLMANSRRSSRLCSPTGRRRDDARRRAARTRGIVGMGRNRRIVILRQ